MIAEGPHNSNRGLKLEFGARDIRQKMGFSSLTADICPRIVHCNVQLCVRGIIVLEADEIQKYILTINIGDGR